MNTRAGPQGQLGVGRVVTIIALTSSVLMVVLNIVSSCHSPRLMCSIMHDQ
jgi:uncharacterized membrane protein